jgi:hypothetical protein
VFFWVSEFFVVSRLILKQHLQRGNCIFIMVLGQRETYECKENHENWQRNCDCFRTMATEAVSSSGAVLLVVHGAIAGRPCQQMNDVTK